MSSDAAKIYRQQADDSQYSWRSMTTQLAINAGISVCVLIAFNMLRPSYTLVYAPKNKYASKKKQPPTIGSGYFSWFNPIAHTTDSLLIEKIGYDGTLFIRFLRMVRKMLYIMTIIGVCVIIPVNVIATYYTGIWPPPSGPQFLSLSSINYYDGNFHKNGNLAWYWWHAAATWIFSIVIYSSLWRFYQEYVDFRRQYFESKEYQRSMHARTLLIFNVPASMRSDEALTKWVDGMGLAYPAQQVCIGRQNPELSRNVEEHEDCVRRLESILSKYLNEIALDEKNLHRKKPMMRQGGILGCGGNEIDAIKYYSERIQVLCEKIDKARSEMSSCKATSYGWIAYEHVAWAHANAQRLASSSSPLLTGLPKLLKDGPTPRVELAPQPKDIIWSNVGLNEHIRNSKHLVASCVFYVFVFLWFIPSSVLSASSNVQSFLGLFPNSTQFIHDHSTFVSLLSSWFTPLFMATFFYILPKVLRRISQHQGYLTGTSLDRQVLAKLFLFFIVNNLFVFTVSSTFIAMYGQIHKAVESRTSLTVYQFLSTMTHKLSQVTKNLSDVSTYWVSYVSLKGLGVIVDLAQIAALVTITLRKAFTNPSPRQLQEFTRPPVFDYPLYYNVLLFFFTVGLLYSVIAPLVLPFTLLYFLLATVVFKYLLMYVFVTGVETGGQIWRVLFNRLLVSTVLFQFIMIGVLNMKSAHIPSLAILPLPLFTLVFKMMCKHRYDRHVYYYRPKIEMPIEKGRVNDNIGFKFGDPAFYAELPVPMVHERVRHLLPKLYRSHEKSLSRPYVSKMTRKTSVRHLSVIQLQHASGGELQFQSMGREDIEIDDSTEGLKGMYKFNDDEEEIDLGDAAQASTSSNERLDCDQKSAAMTSKKKKKNPLKRLGRKLKLPFIRKKNKAGPKKGESPYASHFPLVDTTEVIVEEEEEEEEETCLDYQVLPFQFQMTNGYDYFTDQGSTISSICNENESHIKKVFTGNDPE